MVEEKYYTTKEVAEITGLCITYIRRYGEILGVKKIKGPRPQNIIFAFTEKDIENIKKIDAEKKAKRKNNQFRTNKNSAGNGEKVPLDTLYHRAIRQRKRGDEEELKKTLRLIERKKELLKEEKRKKKMEKNK